MTSHTVETLNYLRSALAHETTSAVVTQNADGSLAISVDIKPGPSELSVDPLVGPTGDSGPSQFPLIPMPDIYDSPSDLPAPGVLTNTLADIGKFWIIYQTDSTGVTSSGAYIWFGTEFRFLPFGPNGPPGAYPQIVPLVTLPGPNKQSKISVPDTTDGSASNPYLLTLELSVPEGPPGRCCPLAKMPDVDEAVPPLTGQFLAYLGQSIDYQGDVLPVWQPANVGDIVPQPYTVPASAFNSRVGVTFAHTVTITSFSTPPQSFPWKPIVFGQIQVFELELSLQPFLVGVEVRLGSPTGTLVARGFGNSLGGVVTIMPHCSSAESPSAQMTPSNSVGLVPANHTGYQGQLFVNLVNDGIAAIYDYQASGASLFVWACPQTTQAQLGKSIYGAFTPKIALSASNIIAHNGLRGAASGFGVITAARVSGIGKVGFLHGRGALVAPPKPRLSVALTSHGFLTNTRVFGAGKVAYLHARGVLTVVVKVGVAAAPSSSGRLTTPIVKAPLTATSSGRGVLKAATIKH